MPGELGRNSEGKSGQSPDSLPFLAKKVSLWGPTGVGDPKACGKEVLPISEVLGFGGESARKSSELVPGGDKSYFTELLHFRFFLLFRLRCWDLFAGDSVFFAQPPGKID